MITPHFSFCGQCLDLLLYKNVYYVWRHMKVHGVFCCIAHQQLITNHMKYNNTIRTNIASLIVFWICWNCILELYNYLKCTVLFALLSNNTFKIRRNSTWLTIKNAGPKFSTLVPKLVGTKSEILSYRKVYLL